MARVTLGNILKYRYGFLLVEDGKPAIHSPLDWKTDQEARTAGELVRTCNQMTVIVEDRSIDVLEMEKKS